MPVEDEEEEDSVGAVNQVGWMDGWACVRKSGQHCSSRKISGTGIAIVLEKFMFPYLSYILPKFEDLVLTSLASGPF